MASTGDPGSAAPVAEDGDAQAHDGAAAARVLVVEDEPGIVDFVRRGLEAEGFDVETALDGHRGRAPCAERAASTRSCST